MTRGILLLCCLATAAAAAQDTSFSQLRLRGGVLVPASIGQVGDAWNAKPGAQVEVASNVGHGEIAFGLAHLGFEPTTSVPSFTETLFSLSWTAPVWTRARASLHAGARVTDIRMDFDDPSLVGGLTTEEETMLAAVARGRVGVGKGFSGFAEVSYGVALHSTRTPTSFVAIGLEREVAMPGWMRAVLR